MANDVLNFKSVFFSWNNKDKELKDLFVRALENKFLSIWESDSDCNGNISDSCLASIEKSSVFVVLITENSIKSEWVKKELIHALSDSYDYLLSNCQPYDSKKDKRIRYIVPIFWSGDASSEPIFKKLLDDQSAVVNNADLDIPDETTFDELSRKVIAALNEHGLENYYNSQIFSESYTFDLGEQSSIETRNNACRFDDIWAERTIKVLDENGYVREDSDIKREELLFNNSPAPSLIIAEGGSGKSWLLQKLLYDIKQSCNECINKLVFYVKLSSFANYIIKTNKELTDYLFEEIYKNASLVFQYSVNNFLSLLTKYENNLYIFFDGMDEIIASSLKNKVFDKINNFYSSYDNAKQHAIFTSRTFSDVSYINRSLRINACCYRLIGMNDIERQKLVDKLFFYLHKTDDEKNGFYLALADINEEIKTNPFFLTQLAIIYSVKGEIPKGYSEIYESSANLYLERGNSNLIPSGLRERLPKAAYYKYVNEFQSGRSFNFDDAYKAISQNEDEAIQDLNFLKNRAIIRNDNFAYQIFMDYYVAKYIVLESTKGVEPYDNKIKNPSCLTKLSEDSFSNDVWDNIIKIVLSLFEIKHIAIFSDVVETILHKNNYELLLEASNKILGNPKAIEIVRFCIAKKIIEETDNGNFKPYAEMFYYGPLYNLYSEYANVISLLSHPSPKILCLLRDFCFMYGQMNKVTEIANLTEKCINSLRQMVEKTFLKSSQRAMLCKIFYFDETPIPQKLLKKFKPIYPREFCVIHAANRLNDDECYIDNTTEFIDELKLFDSANSEDDIGLVFKPNIKERLNKLNFEKITGLILLPSKETGLSPILKNKPKLLYFSMPDNIELLKQYAINFCPHLNYLFLPKSIKTFEKKWCLSCEKLFIYLECSKRYTNIEKKLVENLPDNIMKLRANSVENIEECSWAKLSQIDTLPRKLIKICKNAFSDCSSLASLNIPNSVILIDNSAFEGCSSLTSLNIPNSVILIDNSAFEGCSSLAVYHETINQSNGLSIDCIDNFINYEVCQDGDGSKYISITGYTGKDHNVVIPNSINVGETNIIVTSISNFAFSNCSSLTSITIPDSVTSIGEWAFAGCSSLTSLNIPNSITSIGNYAFFGCSSLTSITIPDSVASIGEWAFEGCSSLTSLNIPNSVASIGRYAFSNCSSLTIYHEAINKPNGWSIDWNPDNQSVIWGFVQDGSTLEGLEYAVCHDGRGNKFVTITNYTGKDSRVVIPNSIDVDGEKINVTSISVRVFSNTHLSKCILGQNLLEICPCAFKGCLLEEIEIPINVQEIGENAFLDNPLKKIKISKAFENQISKIFGDIDLSIIEWID